MNEQIASLLEEFFTDDRLDHYRELSDRFPLWCGVWSAEYRDDFYYYQFWNAHLTTPTEILPFAIEASLSDDTSIHNDDEASFNLPSPESEREGNRAIWATYSAVLHYLVSHRSPERELSTSVSREQTLERWGKKLSQIIEATEGDSIGDQVPKVVGFRSPARREVKLSGR